MTVKIRCILVDDDPTSLSIGKQFARTIPGFDVESFSNPALALEHIKKDETDLLLLDWKMPTIQGPEFIDAIKAKNLKNSPLIIMCSGESDGKKIKELMSKGIDGYIIKPYTRALFCKTLLQAQRKHQLKRKN